MSEVTGIAFVLMSLLAVAAWILKPNLERRAVRLRVHSRDPRRTGREG